MRVLVTAGPTREYLDDVRFLSNPSTGKMGFACASAAADAGHEVTLVTGPVALADPPGVRTVRVVSADDMFRAVRKVYPGVDAVIMTAAVGDYRPARRAVGKLKKAATPLTITLVRTRDILEALGARKGRRILIGFALEVQDPVHRAKEKALRKNLDYIVLNSPRTFGSDRMDCSIYREGQLLRRFRGATKESVAAWIAGLLG